MAAGSLPRGIAISFSNTPQANADVFTAAQTGLTEDNLLGVVLLDVMGNDLGGNAKSLYSLDDGSGSGGPNGDLLLQDAIGVANLSAHGATIWIMSDGRISYDASTLDASFQNEVQSLSDGEFVTDSFTYAIRLGNGTLSWTTATVQIAGANDAPVAVNIAANANENTGNPVTLSASYTDVDAHDTHAFAIDTTGTKGVATDNGDGTFSYDPNGQFESLSFGETATDTFAYTVTDNHGAASTKTATVTIHGENDPVAAADIAGNANEDSGNPVLLTASYADVDAHDTHTFTIDTTATKGAVVNNGNGTFNYNPNGHFESLAVNETATDTFTYTVSDNHGASSTKTATVTIHGENDPVAAANIAANANEDAGNPVTLTASYTDVDAHDTHTFTIDTTGTKGAVVNNGDGTFRYDPHGQFESLSVGHTATDTFSYTVSDNHGTSSTKTATVTIHGENDGPALQEAIGSEPVFGNDSLSLSATMAFSDIDLSDTHSVTFTALGSGYVGDFTPTIATDSTGGIQGSVALSYHLTKQQVMDAGGQFPAQQDYRVTVDDHHGGTSSQIVSIPLGQILSGAGGGDDGGPPTVLPPVFTNVSPPNPFLIGHNFGEIRDNPFVLHQSFIPDGGFISDPTNLFTQGTLSFLDPDGGHHHASVDLANARIVSHTVTDSNGVPHPATSAPIVGALAGTWHVDVRDDLSQVQWSYTLNETDIRGMTSGELETLVVPITVYEDGVGQSTENVRIDLVGADEPTSMLSPDIVLTATTDITPYLLPIDLATHVQTENVSLSEDPLVTGSTSHHILTGTIAYVDPDLLNRPTVTMTVADMTHSLDSNPQDVPFNAAVQPLMAGFHYTVESFGNYGNIHWTYDVQDSALDFLAQGSVMTASANFSVGTLVGGAFTTVNVNLHGANDPVVIPGSTSTAMNVPLHGSASGNFTITDPDWGPDGHSVDFVPHNPSTHGFIFGGTPVETGWGGAEPISWNYIADFGPGTLLAGEHDVWDVVVHDHFGATATYTLDFHLV